MEHLKRVFAGAEAGSSLVGFDDLNIAQARSAGGPLEDYEITVSRAEFMKAIEPAYNEWLETQKDDDARHGDSIPNIFEQLGYPPLAEFSEHPAEFSEFVIYLAPLSTMETILPSFPWSNGRLDWVIVSIDGVELTDSTLRLTGKAYRPLHCGCSD